MLTTKPLARAAPRRGAAVGIGAARGAPAPNLGRFAGAGSVRRFGEARSLVAALARGEVQAAVRGTLAPGAALEALGRLKGASIAGRAVLFEPSRGQGVLFGPVGVTEGRGALARVRFASEAVIALRSTGLATEDPLVAVLSFGREEDAPRGPNVARSLREGAAVVRRLQARGVDAFHAGAQIEDVLGDADVVVAPDGASGNLAFRALHLAAGMRSFGALVLGAPVPFVDTSRRRGSFEDPLRLAAFLAAATPAR